MLYRSVKLDCIAHFTTFTLLIATFVSIVCITVRDILQWIP
jgi:hypothetical protein